MTVCILYRRRLSASNDTYRYVLRLLLLVLVLCVHSQFFLSQSPTIRLTLTSFYVIYMPSQCGIKNDFIFGLLLYKIYAIHLLEIFAFLLNLSSIWGQIHRNFVFIWHYFIKKEEKIIFKSNKHFWMESSSTFNYIVYLYFIPMYRIYCFHGQLNNRHSSNT